MKGLSVVNPSRAGIRLSVLVNMVALLAIIAIGIIPALNKTIINAYRLVFFLLWLFSIGPIKRTSFKRLEQNIIIWWCLYLVLQLNYSILGLSTDFIYFIGKTHIYMIPIAMIIVTKFYSPKEMKLLWVATFFIFLVCLLQNVLIGLRGGIDIYSEDEKESNVGTTAFVVICLYAIVSCWLIYKQSRNKKHRIICLSVLIVSAFHMIFQNNRATTTIVLFLIALGIVFTSYFKKKLSVKKIVIWSVLIILLITPLLPSLFQSLSALFSDVARLSSRLDDLAILASSGDIGDLDNGGSLFHRFMLWLTSINTFFSSVSNFFFGIGEIRYDDDFNFRLNCGVGFHSEFFDLAARYGILGLFIFYFALKCTFRYLLNLCENEEVRNIIYIAIISMIFQMFINNMFNNVGAIIMPLIFLPVSIVLLKYKQL